MLCYPIYHLVAGAPECSLLECETNFSNCFIHIWVPKARVTCKLKKLVFNILGAKKTPTINSIHHDSVADCKQEEELSHFRLLPWLDLLDEVMVIKGELPICICVPAKINLLEERSGKGKENVIKKNTYNLGLANDMNFYLKLSLYAKITVGCQHFLNCQRFTPVLKLKDTLWVGTMAPKSYVEVIAPATWEWPFLERRSSWM